MTTGKLGAIFGRSRWRAVFPAALPVLAMALAGCDDTQSTAGAASQARPVTVMELHERDFARETRLTGSVGLYRVERVGFEVKGRLLSVRDLGHEVTGPAHDANGAKVREGDVIGRLSDTRYRFRVRALEARLQSLKSEQEAQRIDVEQVAQAQLQTAKANLRVAETEISAADRRIDEARIRMEQMQKDLRRQEGLMRSNVGRQKGLDDAQAAYDGAKSRVAQMEAQLKAREETLDARRAAVSVASANIALKRAQLESTHGKIAELQEKLNEAKQDLADTVLRAPFTGRITAIHAVQGAVLEAGSPVATLSLFDPIQVHVEVSADTDRRLRTGDTAWLYPKDPVNPNSKRLIVNAVIFEKDLTADPKTRTFSIALMARNERRKVEDLDPETRDLPVADDFLPVVKRFKGEPGPLFVPLSSIYTEDGTAYVLRLPGIGFQSATAQGAVGKHVPEKVKVSLGEEYLGVVKWDFRSLVEPGPLKEGDFLVVNPQKEHLSGLAVGRAQWLFRPGDLVPVRFALDATPRGYYVPTNAISRIGDESVIFSVKDGRATKVPVSVHETHGEYQRIGGAGLSSGLPVIVDGVHFVSDGQRVSVLAKKTIPR